LIAHDFSHHGGRGDQFALNTGARISRQLRTRLGNAPMKTAHLEGRSVSAAWQVVQDRQHHSVRFNTDPVMEFGRKTVHPFAPSA
jgi:hypothetical protein